MTRQERAAAAQQSARWHAMRRSSRLYALVAAGSAIGGVLRGIVSLAVQGPPGAHFPWSTFPWATFPWATLFVNVTGSFLIGFYATLSGPEGRLFAGSHQRQFVMAGVCGGYTTFSVFSLETFDFLRAGELTSAGLNLGASIVGWLSAVWIGHKLATSINDLRRS